MYLSADVSVAKCEDNDSVIQGRGCRWRSPLSEFKPGGQVSVPLMLWGPSTLVSNLCREGNARNRT